MEKALKKLDQYVVTQMLAQLSPETLARAISEAKKKRRQVWKSAALAGLASSAGVPGIIGSAVKPDALGVVNFALLTTFGAGWGKAAQGQKDRIVDDYVRRFGANAPALSGKSMALAVEANKLGAIMPTMRTKHYTTVEQMLQKNKVIDLRNMPEAGKIIAPALLPTELYGLGITRTEKLRLLNQIKLHQLNRDISKTRFDKNYRWKTISSLRKELNTFKTRRGAKH